MELSDNIKLELYVATINFPCGSQYEESLKVLEYIDKPKVRNDITIIPLDDLVFENHIFIIMGGSQRERKLPYLEYTNKDAGVFSDYMGQQEIIEHFERLGLH